MKRGNVPDRRYTEGLGPGGRKGLEWTESWKNHRSRVSKKYTLQNETGNSQGLPAKEVCLLRTVKKVKYFNIYNRERLLIRLFKG